MSNDTDDLAVLDDFLQVLLNGFASQVVLPLLAGLGERLLLALVPEKVNKQKNPGGCVITLASS